MPTPLRQAHTIRATLLAVVLSLLASLVSAAPSHAQLDPLVTRLSPAVVLVDVTHVLGWRVRGSGFLYDPAGFILTNHHVVEGAVAITVTLPDKRSFPATVVDYLRREEFLRPEIDPTIDVDAAVLKIDAVGLPALPLGNSEALRAGEGLIVLGYPGGIGDEVRVTRGTFLAHRRGWLQADALLEPGESGGPVVDETGRVVGLATFAIEGPLASIGGVVAIESVRALAEEALNPGSGRYREVKVTGMEYSPAPALHARRHWRITYNPGTAPAQAYVRDWTIVATGAESFNGATVVTLRGDDGSETKDFLDAEGVLRVSQTAAGWTYSFSQPLVVLPFPAIIGQAWRQRWRSVSGRGGAALLGTLDCAIGSAEEVVTVPAGTFAHVMRVDGVGHETYIRGTQTGVYTVSSHDWRAPGVGLIRTVFDTAETEEHLVEELVSY